MTEDRRDVAADLEIGGGWRAGSARWEVRAHRQTETLGQPETEELSERERLPERPAPGKTYRNVARRWRFSAWLRESRR